MSIGVTVASTLNHERPITDHFAPLRETPTVNVPEAAHWLGVSEGTIYRWASDGTLPRIRIGKRVRIRTADLLAILEER